ncbi:MAG: fasciclin domain-containing protein [Flavobacterium sp.]|nr:fasciclin domain-containing protein [Flavobacterium sp.]
MKTNMKFILVALIAIVSFSVTSCSSSDSSDPAPTPKTITEIAQGNANLSILVKALTKTDLAGTLNAAGTFTVFAPDNAAFTAIGISSESIDGMTVEETAELKNILLNHVLTTKYTAAQLTTGYKKTLAAPASNPTGKIDMFISNTADGVILNSTSEVSTPNIAASNGIIHIVDEVIALPSIVTFVGSDPNLTSLYAAVTRLDQASAGFVGLLSGEPSSPFTVFAPTNAAFTSYPTESGNTASELTGGNLTKILKYHVVSGQNYSSAQLFGLTTLTTLLDTGAAGFQAITVVANPTSGLQLKDNNNKSTSLDVAYDIQANNGIIHQIKNVLKPNL